MHTLLKAATKNMKHTDIQMSSITDDTARYIDIEHTQNNDALNYVQTAHTVTGTNISYRKHKLYKFII